MNMCAIVPTMILTVLMPMNDTFLDRRGSRQVVYTITVIIITSIPFYVCNPHGNALLQDISKITNSPLEKLQILLTC